jgi:hypothetical protein
MALRARLSRNSRSTREAVRLDEKRLSSAVAKLRPLSLRFTDASLEHSFQEQYFRDNIGYVRTAHVIAIVGWAFFGLFVPPPGSHESYLVITLLAGVGVTSVSLGLTYTRRFAIWWQPSVVALVVVYPPYPSCTGCSGVIPLTGRAWSGCCWSWRSPTPSFGCSTATRRLQVCLPSSATT